jgi:hypothetical protein
MKHSNTGLDPERQKGVDKAVGVNVNNRDITFPGNSRYRGVMGENEL